MGQTARAAGLKSTESTDENEEKGSVSRPISNIMLTTKSALQTAPYSPLGKGIPSAPAEPALFREQRHSRALDAASSRARRYQHTVMDARARSSARLRSGVLLVQLERLRWTCH
jgi:hypothetical protein